MYIKQPQSYNIHTFKQKVSSRLYSRLNAVENFHLSKMTDDLDASEEGIWNSLLALLTAYHNMLFLIVLGVGGNDVVVVMPIPLSKVLPHGNLLLLGDFTFPDEQVALINEFSFPQ